MITRLRYGDLGSSWGRGFRRDVVIHSVPRVGRAGSVGRERGRVLRESSQNAPRVGGEQSSLQILGPTNGGRGWQSSVEMRVRGFCWDWPGGRVLVAKGRSLRDGGAWTRCVGHWGRDLAH